MEKYGLITLIISEGTVEILYYLSQRDVGYFKDLRNLRNIRTGRCFSATTVSTRVKELIEKGAIERTIALSGSRNVIAYRITDIGKKAISITDDFEEELRKIFKK